MNTASLQWTRLGGTKPVCLGKANPGPFPREPPQVAVAGRERAGSQLCAADWLDRKKRNHAGMYPALPGSPPPVSILEKQFLLRSPASPQGNQGSER